MRNAFADEITKLAIADERVVLLSGDIGNRLFDMFKAKCPGRFYNCGVAEANMIGVAAGLALCGLRPVCYTIAPFVTYRCMEQIRVDLCYHHLPVAIVGTGSGLAYASLGGTHHSCEEVAMLRSLKKGEKPVHNSPPALTIGRSLVLREGGNACILAAGVLLAAALEAAEILAGRGTAVEVVSCPTIKPLDVELLRRVFSTFGLVATVEEHSVLGGFGGSVAEWLSDQKQPAARLLRFGTPDEFLHETCEQEHAHEKFGLTSQAMARRIEAALAPAAR
jgi:transketolase